MPSITCDAQGFLLDHQRVYLLAGEMHYFRVPRCHWRDRLRSMRACGLNTVSTYIAWNVHEFQEGVYDFAGQQDLPFFLQLCQEEGLYVVLRPGPYICAEWHFGGFPVWLEPKQLPLRSSDPEFLRYVERWFAQLNARVAPWQYTHGGPVILVQAENEYAYRNRHDPAYWEALVRMHRAQGIDVPLFSCEKPWALRDGWAPGIIPCSDFGDNAKANFASVRAFDKDAPLYVPEFYPGWFTMWGDENAIWPRSAAAYWQKGLAVARELLEIAAHGGSVSYYMMHGGTNFGFWASKLTYNITSFHTTSYDFQAPIAEDGRRTSKFYLLQPIHAFIQRHAALLQTASPAPERAQLVGVGIRALIRELGEQTVVYLRNLDDVPRTATTPVGEITLAPGATGLYIAENGVISDAVVIDDNPCQPGDDLHVAETVVALPWEASVSLPETAPAYPDTAWQVNAVPLSLAQVGVYQGFGWYRTTLTAPGGPDTLAFPYYADRLNLFINGRHAGAVGAFAPRKRLIDTVLEPGENTLVILAEDKGRTNTGEAMGEPKGMLGPVFAGAHEWPLEQWEWAPADDPSLHGVPALTTWQPLAHTPIPYPQRETTAIKASVLGASFTWYRTVVTLEATPGATLLFIDGEPDLTDVYINGQHAGAFRGWYDGMESRFDITPYVSAGANTILLRTTNTERKVAAPRFVTLLTARDIVSGHPWRMHGNLHGELDTAAMTWRPATATGVPTCYRATFTLQALGDLRITPRGLGAGYIVLNGVNLGRYNQVGPQESLYAPSGWLRDGVNTLLIFDEHGGHPQDVTIERIAVVPVAHAIDVRPPVSAGKE